MSLVQEGGQYKANSPHRIRIHIPGYSLGLRRDELRYVPPAQTPDIERRLTDGSEINLDTTNASRFKISDKEKAVKARTAEGLVDQRQARIAALKKAMQEREAQRIARIKAPLREAIQAKTPLVERVAVKLNGHARLELPNHKPEIGEGRRPMEHLAEEIDGEEEEFGLVDNDIQPDTAQRVWSDEILAQGDLVEGEEIDPFAYEGSLRSAGANAIFDSSMTPDEIANMTEDYTEFAGTHEQFNS